MEYKNLFYAYAYIYAFYTKINYTKKREINAIWILELQLENRTTNKTFMTN